MAKLKNSQQVAQVSPDMGAIVQAVMAALKAQAQPVEPVVEKKLVWPTTTATTTDDKLNKPVVEKRQSEALLGNAPTKDQERMIYTAAGYGFAVEPTTTIAEYRKACESAKASGRKWRMAYALSAWKVANPGKLAYGVTFTPEQNKAAIDAWKASKRTTEPTTKAPTVDAMTAKAQAMRAAGFTAREVYAALNA